MTALTNWFDEHLPNVNWDAYLGDDIASIVYDHPGIVRIEFSDGLEVLATPGWDGEDELPISVLDVNGDTVAEFVVPLRADDWTLNPRHICDEDVDTYIQIIRDWKGAYNESR